MFRHAQYEQLKMSGIVPWIYPRFSTIMRPSLEALQSGLQDTDFKNWRVSPHYSAVNLVRSGRKQPQLMSVSAGGKARLLFFWGRCDLKRLLMLAGLVLFTSRAGAVDGVFVEYGMGNMVEMTRAGAQWDWDERWQFGDGWQATGFWEAALGTWRGFKPENDNQTITEVGITPVWRLTREGGEGAKPYLEGGFVGMHLISPTFIYTNRKFGSAFEFGNHIGFGVSFGQRREFELGYRFQHISNAGLKQPNQGINFNQLHLIYHF